MNVVFNPDKTQPFAQWQEVEITFSSTANADTVVPHDLMPLNAEGVNYIPIRKDRAADIYHDTSVTRKPWQNTYILLRSTVANAKVTLLLYVSHSR